MQTGLNFSDWAVFALYFVIVTAYGFWIYNQKRKVAANTKDYFLAEGSLTWWAIWGFIDCLKYLSRTVYWYVGQWLYRRYCCGGL